MRGTNQIRISAREILEIIALKPVNILMIKSANIKTGTLDTIFQKSAGKANPYIRFGYGSQKICNHTRVQVSVPMNADPVNVMHASQQSTKEGLCEELEGGFR